MCLCVTATCIDYDPGCSLYLVEQNLYNYICYNATYQVVCCQSCKQVAARYTGLTGKQLSLHFIPSAQCLSPGT
jgi:hypothetical protein